MLVEENIFIYLCSLIVDKINMAIRIAIIGAGISGLSTARFFSSAGEKVTIFEKMSKPGGLIRCERIKGSLFHICGGHVFNSKRKDVLDWFWQFFCKDEEFVKADRKSVIFMDKNLIVPYPIENHVYLFDEKTQKNFINDLLFSVSHPAEEIENFEDFLKIRFGNTLYGLYFKPYNEKIWKRKLNDVPIFWLEGKLPMPTVEEMFYNNMNHIEEKSFVHSVFWYEKNNGSQYIADKLANGLDIRFDNDILEIKLTERGTWIISGDEFDKVVFCGNIKSLPNSLKGVNIDSFINDIEDLEYHGTTSVFCEIEHNPYSWIYLPSAAHRSHRIICTGNFSSSNNADGKMTGTVEFTDYIGKDDILENLNKIPFVKRYLSHYYNEYTYPIQDSHTRELIMSIKNHLEKHRFYITGRFADWEYYNMDAAIGASMDLFRRIQHE